MRAPRDVHRGKHIAGVEELRGRGRVDRLRRLARGCTYFWRRRRAAARRSPDRPRAIRIDLFQRGDRFAADERQRDRDRAARERFVDGPLGRGEELVRRPVVAVDAVHAPAFARRRSGHRSLRRRGTRARLPLASFSRTYGISCRLSSVAMYSISLCGFMCQWMPAPRPNCGMPPPTWSSRRVGELGVLLVVRVRRE